MTRDPRDRFADILAAIDRCLSYREHLPDPDPKIAEMAYDAVLRNLAVIGEAARALPQEREGTLTADTLAGHRWAAQHCRPRVLPHRPQHHRGHPRQPARATG